MSPNSLTEQFIFGMSFLDAYIHLCNKTRLTDINILAETFMCRLLGILYQGAGYICRRGTYGEFFFIISKRDNHICKSIL